MQNMRDVTIDTMSYYCFHALPNSLAEILTNSSNPLVHVYFCTFVIFAFIIPSYVTKTL